MASLDLAWQTFRPEEGFYTTEVQTPRPLPIRSTPPLANSFSAFAMSYRRYLKLVLPRLATRIFMMIALSYQLSAFSLKQDICLADR